MWKIRLTQFNAFNKSNESKGIFKSIYRKKYECKAFPITFKVI